ncbi:hypothetical protein niasHS_005367 [Heterodera schachtii]|uniref:Uncharacterized protein n=1 Tax=Heterodera schachtii TaxID=97005 RepID=A0ABD2J9F4_HETSC
MKRAGNTRFSPPSPPLIYLPPFSVCLSLSQMPPAGGRRATGAASARRLAKAKFPPPPDFLFFPLIIFGTNDGGKSRVPALNRPAPVDGQAADGRSNERSVRRWPTSKVCPFVLCPPRQRRRSLCPFV